jgi:energy-coupling factor transporter ATP-binding protein EcfA2
VLELAATLGVALVAVTVGVRLAEGGLGLEAGLTVLVLAPELYLPLRRLGAEYHASADGLAVADRMLALLDAPPAASREGRGRPEPRGRAGALGARRLLLSGSPGSVLDGLDLELAPGETVALVGESGAGKSTVAALLLGFLEPTAAASRSAASTSRAAAAEDWHALVAWVPSTLRSCAQRRGQHQDRAAASDHAVRAGRALAGADASSARCPTATTRWWATAGARCRRGAQADRAGARFPRRPGARRPRRADGRSRSGERGARQPRRAAAGRGPDRCCSSPTDPRWSPRRPHRALEAGAAVAVPARRAA